MPTESQQIELLRAEIAKLQKQLKKAESKCEQGEMRAQKTEKRLQCVEQQRDVAQERFKKSHVTFCFAHYDTLKLLNTSLDMLAEYCPDILRSQAKRLQWLVNKVYNDLDDVLQTGREAFLSYLLSVGPESLDKLFASVADSRQDTAASIQGNRKQYCETGRQHCCTGTQSKHRHESV